MEEILESRLKPKLAERDPEVDLKAQRAKTSAKRPELLVVDSNLTDQSNVCLKNLELCIEKAHYAAVGQPVLASSLLHRIEQGLRGLRLRMQIWRKDCMIVEGGFSSITRETEPSLCELISSSLKELNSSLSAIQDHISTIWGETVPSSPGEKINSTSNLEIHDYTDIPTIIREDVNALNDQLRYLARLRSSIQMAIAIHASMGPLANLRARIEMHMEEDANRRSDNRTIASTGSSVSDLNYLEQCPTCQDFLPYHALSHHIVSHPTEDAEAEAPLPKPSSPTSNGTLPKSIVTDESDLEIESEELGRACEELGSSYLEELEQIHDAPVLTGTSGKDFGQSRKQHPSTQTEIVVPAATRPSHHPPTAGPPGSTHGGDETAELPGESSTLVGTQNTASSSTQPQDQPRTKTKVRTSAGDDIVEEATSQFPLSAQDLTLPVKLESGNSGEILHEQVDKLRLFREIVMGYNSPRANHSIYYRIVRNEDSLASVHLIYTVFVPLFYLIGVGLGVATAALGALKTSAAPVIALGAVSVATTGFLAYCYARDEPYNTRSQLSSVRRAREYVENRERLSNWGATSSI